MRKQRVELQGDVECRWKVLVAVMRINEIYISKKLLTALYFCAILLVVISRIHLISLQK